MTATRRDEENVLPIGTVTLLLSDIEGSTLLWETSPDEMAGALARFDDLVSTTVAAHQGARPVEQGEGDSFVAGFARPSDALACAIALQVELSDQDKWPFRVRMALHTGELRLRGEGNYAGSTINRCARVRAIAHGGQTLVTRTTHDLVVDDLPDGASLEDMGVHRLRDLARPEHIFQLLHAELPAVSEPLRSLQAVAHNLPVQLTSFVGRQHEIEAVTSLIDGNRMVTLLGTGGCGKTRLSLQVAAQIAERHPDGVWFVELAPVEDEAAVPQAVAQALGVREQAGRPLIETLVDAVGDRSMLVVLDNCEHVVAASARLATTLLSACRRLVILATSREALSVPGEVTFHVPSLSVPHGPDIDAGTLAGFEAVELFVERAARARPTFAVTADNAPAVADICHRLDGIPLALELAAARMRMLSVQQIREGLSDRFQLLTTGARTLMPRQQTLRASVDWSFELLGEAERVTLCRLSVFAGGFDLEAAEAVAGASPIAPGEVFDLLASLVDKSLVVVDDEGGGIRYRLLETMKQYGQERLVADGAEADVARLHRQHYVDLLSRAAAEEEGPNQAEWAHRVRRELDNIRAGLHSAMRDGDSDALMALTIGVGNVLTLSGATAEHQRWLEEAISVTTEDSPLRANALYQLGVAVSMLGDLDGAIDKLGASIPLYRAKGDHAGALWALTEYAWNLTFRDGLTVGRPVYEQGIAEARERGEHGPRFSLQYGWAAMLAYAGDFAEAARLFRQALSEPGPVMHFVEWTYIYLAWALAVAGRAREAETALAEMLGGRRVDELDVEIAVAGGQLVAVKVLGGHLAEAEEMAHQAAALASATVSILAAPALLSRGMLATAMGDDAAVAMLRQAAGMAEDIGVQWLPSFLVPLAEAHLAAGDLAAATAETERAIEISRERDLPGYIATALVTLARIRRRAGDAAAEDLGHQGLTSCRAMDLPAGVIDALELLGVMAIEADSHEEGLRLLGAGAAERARLGYGLRLPLHQADQDAAVATALSALGDDGFRRAWSEGEAMTLEEAAEYAGRGRGERKRPASGWASLTPMEEKVVALVAEGLTNPQVGERLFISRHTVDTHLRHVFAKLGVSTRAQLAGKAAERAQPRDGADA